MMKKSSCVALSLKPPAAVVFDLDDTLYKELDFVHSGFRAAAELIEERSGIKTFELMKAQYAAGSSDIFQDVLESFNIDSVTCAELLDRYRNHHPQLELPQESRRILDEAAGLGLTLGLLTDGRSTTQRNKIAALGIAHYFSLIIISEEFGSQKPDARNYAIFEQSFNTTEIVYIADNIGKDFINAKARGWQTVCLRGDERNIHVQDLSIDGAYHPDHIVDSLLDIRFEIS